MVHNVCGPDQCFRGHAPDIDAGAADRTMTDESDLRALLGGRDSGRESSGASADHHGVIAAVAVVCVWSTAVVHGFSFRVLTSTSRQSAATDEADGAAQQRIASNAPTPMLIRFPDGHAGV